MGQDSKYAVKLFIYKTTNLGDQAGYKTEYPWK